MGEEVEGIYGIIAGGACCLICLCGFPALVIVGIVFLSMQDTRQTNINLFNDEIAEWQNTEYDVFNDFIEDTKTTFDASYYVQGVHYEYSEGSTNKSTFYPSVLVEKAKSSYDNPQIQSWNASFLTGELEIREILFDVEEKNLDVTVSLGNEKYTISKALFLETSGRYTDSCDEEDCITDRTQCIRSNGIYKYTSLFGDNCFWRYNLDSLCLLFDQSTGKFTTMSEDTTSSGCYRKVVLKSRADLSYSEVDYSLDTTMSSYDEKTEYNYYSIKVEIRSVDDPLIQMAVITDGDNDFGMAKVTKTVIGVVCLFIGLIPACILGTALAVAIVILCLTCLISGGTIIIACFLEGPTKLIANIKKSWNENIKKLKKQTKKVAKKKIKKKNETQLQGFDNPSDFAVPTQPQLDYSLPTQNVDEDIKNMYEDNKKNVENYVKDEFGFSLYE